MVTNLLIINILVYFRVVTQKNVNLFRGKDFGNYACKARNSLGEAEARVQLHGKKFNFLQIFKISIKKILYEMTES